MDALPSRRLHARSWSGTVSSSVESMKALYQKNMLSNTSSTDHMPATACTMHSRINAIIKGCPTQLWLSFTQ